MIIISPKLKISDDNHLYIYIHMYKVLVSCGIKQCHFAMHVNISDTEHSSRCQILCVYFCTLSLIKCKYRESNYVCVKISKCHTCPLGIIFFLWNFISIKLDFYPDKFGSGWEEGFPLQCQILKENYLRQFNMFALWFKMVFVGKPAKSAYLVFWR